MDTPAGRFKGAPVGLKSAPGSFKNVSGGFQVTSETLLRGFQGSSRASQMGFRGYWGVFGGLQGGLMGCQGRF